MASLAALPTQGSQTGRTLSTPGSREMEVVKVFGIRELTRPSRSGWLRLARATREAKTSGRRSACSSRCSATSCVMGVVNCLVGEMGAAGVIGRLSRRGRVLCPALPDDGRRYAMKARLALGRRNRPVSDNNNGRGRGRILQQQLVCSADEERRAVG